MDYGWHDLVGNLGVLCILGTHFALVSGRLPATRLAYPALNAAGSALIALSLTVDFNLSALVVEASWCLISLYGLVRVLRVRTPEAA